MMNNVKNILFAACILAPAQNIFAASYLPAFIKNIFRRNEVCVSPEFTFPGEIMVHNVKAFSRDSDGNIIPYISVLENTPRTITTPVELEALIKNLEKALMEKLLQ